MLTKHNYFNLINASNIESGILGHSFVASLENFEFYRDLKLGLPILIQNDQKVFRFNYDNTFEIPEKQLIKILFNLSDKKYVGYAHSFNTNIFLSKYEIRKEFKALFNEIVEKNLQTLRLIKELKNKYGKVGAFQTRNIPHFGHEKIIEKMLTQCDHLVINPVIGPKKRGDVCIKALRDIYDFLILEKYDNRISFQPIIANMFYAGPREAIHHALLRKKLGFDLFSVGRDHAGAEGAYFPSAAPRLLISLKDDIELDVLSHYGAVFCDVCNSVRLRGDCNHEISSFTDISGTHFRKCLSEKKYFQLADKAMQEFIFDSNMELFEK